MDSARPMQGIVTAIQSGSVEVSPFDPSLISGAGEPLSCTLRGRLKKEWQMVTSLIVVGDLVSYRRTSDGSGVIEEIYPRRSKLSRPGFHHYEHIIAANVEQVLIVASVHQPPFKRNLVDRFLLLARQMALTPILVVNKCDLEDERVIRSWLAPLEPSGVQMVLTSAAAGLGLNELRSLLAQKISCFAGQSGVGKSSLLNALFPNLKIKTQATSWANKGRHTTTGSRLYPLPGGGYLADTPGIKELALWEAGEEDLAEVFPEIEALAGGCKFRNCTHAHEPKCAVKAAVERGEIDENRYQSYLRLQKSR
ncbi:MAG: ribosome small subunit-dependent GTPase A [Bacillota bacterium]